MNEILNDAVGITDDDVFDELLINVMFKVLFAINEDDGDMYELFTME